MDNDIKGNTEARERDNRPVEGADGEDAKMTDAKPTYRSWKKKYKKLMVLFEQKSRQSEDYHKQEQKALAQIKRIAIENDRILDMLLDINNSPQIPADKRVDITLDKVADPNALLLPIDSKPASERLPTGKALRQLLRDVPHKSLEEAKKHYPELKEDLQPFEGERYPPNFLSADDIDNYLWDLDVRLGNKLLPSLAPLARDGASAASSNRDYALKNPTSEYNWLRKHAPKTFLQDVAAVPDAGGEEGGEPVAKKSARGGKAERGGAKSTGRAKRLSSRRDGWDDDEQESPGLKPARGKRKARDDDPGYRPGGGSRPTKRKRKSDADDAVPVRRAKKAAVEQTLD